MVFASFCVSNLFCSAQHNISLLTDSYKLYPSIWSHLSIPVLFVLAMLIDSCQFIPCHTISDTTKVTQEELIEETVDWTQIVSPSSWHDVAGDWVSYSHIIVLMYLFICTCDRLWSTRVIINLRNFLWSSSLMLARKSNVENLGVVGKKYDCGRASSEYGCLCAVELDSIAMEMLAVSSNS